MTSPPTATTALAHAAPHGSPAGAKVDIERPRRDAVTDYLLGGSLNTAIDRMFAADLVTAFPHLLQVAVTAAEFDRDAAQAILDRGIRRFLILGTGGLPITTGPSTLTTLHEAGARLVVIEHDPITKNVHDLADNGAATERAQVVYVPPAQCGGLARHPAVVDLLSSGEPVGISATALLRPRKLNLAAIVSLLQQAAAGSVLAITQLITPAHDPGIAASLADIATRFDQADIPIAVTDRAEADKHLGVLRHLPTGEPDAPWYSPRSAGADTSAVFTAAVTGPAPSTGHAATRPATPAGR
jgi:hypothetical protein